MADFAIKGNPGGIRSRASEMLALAGTFETVGSSLRSIQTDGWTGRAADHYRDKFSAEPQRWSDAGAGFRRAATALSNWAGYLEWAQQEAGRCQAEYERGDHVTNQAQAAYNNDVRQAEVAQRAWEAQNGPGTYTLNISPFVDPGQPIRDKALSDFDACRARLQREAETCAYEVDRGCDAAPNKRNWLEKVGDGLVDFVVGIYEGLEGLVSLSWGFVAGLLDDLADLASGELTMEEFAAKYEMKIEEVGLMLEAFKKDPGGFLKEVGKAILDWDTWKDNPAKAFGRIVPDIVIAVLTFGGGAVATKLASSMGKFGGAMNKITSVAKGLDKLNDLPSSKLLEAFSRKFPDSDVLADMRRAMGCEPGSSGAFGEPIDVGTGRHFMSQEDLTIEGALPLRLVRSYESGRPWGVSFGQSWTTLLDERLEFTDGGVVLVRADGVAMRYPRVPEPGLDRVLPDNSRDQWVLSVNREGIYTAYDPVAHVLRRYLVAPLATNAPLMQIATRGGHWVGIDRTDEGIPYAIRHDGGATVHVMWDIVDGVHPRVESLALAGAGVGGEDLVVASYRYDEGNLVEVVNSSGRSLHFGWDERGRMVSWKDRNGVEYVNAFDDEDRVVEQSGPDGQMHYVYRYEHDEETGNRVTIALDGLGAEWRWLVDGFGRNVAEVDPLGNVTSYTYDEHGNRTSVTDALGATTQVEYDAAGRVLRHTDPAGAVTTLTRDEQGELVAVTRADGSTSRQTLDDRGRVVSASTPLGAEVRYTYNEVGDVVRVADPIGRVVELAYDAAGRVVERSDESGNQVSIVRDAFGRPISQIGADGAVTSWEWSPEGWLLRQVEADGAVQLWEYDAEGNVTAQVDAMGRVTQFEYGAFDTLTARIEADGTRLEFRHDAEMRLAEVVAGDGAVWSYDRDPAGRVVAETSFDGYRLDYRLDALGRRVERRNAAGNVRTMSYDVRGQLVSVTADGVTESFSYDVLGNMTGAVNPDVALEISYDAAGNVVREAVNGDAVLLERDAGGQVVRRVTPAGVESQWSYGFDGSPTSLWMAGSGLSFSLNASARQASMRLSTGPEILTLWDERGRVTEQRLHADEQAGWSVGYGYSLGGELVERRDSVSGIASYGLDARGRVVSVSGAVSEWYGYDARGNVAQASWDAPVVPEARGPRVGLGERVLSAGRDRVEVDAAGRVTERRRSLLTGGTKVWEFEWDGFDRLVRARTPDGGVWTYVYDALGRRVEKRGVSAAGCEVVRFSWVGSQLVEQRGDAGALTWEYRGWSPVAQVDTDAGGGVSFAAVAADPNGAPMRMVATDGTTVWTGRSTLWGMALDAAAMPLRFAGQYYDAETGLHYNLHRYMDPTDGRYLSPDPLGLGAGSVADGRYVDNPHVQIDPLGLMGCHVDLVPPARRHHILDGEVRPNGTFGGGHRPGTGFSGKSEFPSGWSDDRIMHEISDVATDPSLQWRPSGKPSDFFIDGTREGVDIQVLIRHGQIWTAYPTNVPRNP